MGVTLEKLVALCKRKGFVYQTADIYGGLNGVYDTGPLGKMQKDLSPEIVLIDDQRTGKLFILMAGGPYFCNVM